MQKGHNLEFSCQGCNQSVSFGLFDLDKQPLVECPSCHKRYSFDDTLRRQLRKFEALCRQIQESEEILSNTAVGITIGEHNVKVPYKLLLTRLSSALELKMDGQALSINFRFEPVVDLPKIS
jgi:hypothetical protein